MSTEKLEDIDGPDEQRAWYDTSAELSDLGGTVTYTAPAHWASYLINGDATGFDYDECDVSEDQEAADEFIASVGMGSPIDCGESEFIAYPDFGVGGDCCAYTFYKKGAV